ncbi:heme-binding protein [Xylanimonas allomyrinae]|uniref:Heme-binding protein n=1 Tax=Xylanimonas allomyrinae TaxID=2509459 RepID=A0A4P6EI90_9MICO|nr:heme-binding protein [Xylanimonas allomyrinae]QAY62212.1 heme-binding protein [Xylanimonas allomyrinae]
MGMVFDQRSLTLDGATAVLDGARRRAVELGVPVCLAVADPAGTLLAFARMDGAARLSIALAQDKAYTVAAFGLPTSEWYPMIANDPALLHGIVKADRLMIFPGGVPVRLDGVTVGAVGVSGGTAAQDDEIAAAGAAALAAA